MFCFYTQESIALLFRILVEQMLSQLSIAEQPNAALQRPGDNCASGKLSMRGTLIPVRCKRLFYASR
jgi:hypothetical protein